MAAEQLLVSRGDRTHMQEEGQGYWMAKLQSRNPSPEPEAQYEFCIIFFHWRDLSHQALGAALFEFSAMLEMFDVYATWNRSLERGASAAAQAFGVNYVYS